MSVLDWTKRNNPLFNQKWDVIIGADIIYIEETFPHLIETMKMLNCDYILLSCRLRYKKDDLFIEMTKDWFNVHEVFYDTSRDVHLYRFIKKIAT